MKKLLKKLSNYLNNWLTSHIEPDVFLAKDILKLKSDGTPQGTFLIDTRTGARIAGITLCSWSLSTAEKGAMANITLWGLPADLEATQVDTFEDDVPDQEFPTENFDNVLHISDYIRNKK